MIKTLSEEQKLQEAFYEFISEFEDNNCLDIDAQLEINTIKEAHEELTQLSSEELFYTFDNGFCTKKECKKIKEILIARGYVDAQGHFIDRGD